MTSLSFAPASPAAISSAAGVTAASFGAVFSFVTGHRKPDPATYEACCAALDVAPQECLYVGDGGSDELAGAARVGMTPVHLQVAGEETAVVYGRHLAWAGASITTLPDLLELLS